ncbi:MAG: CHAT domain-containing protein, partial [Symploca sp. SIO2D2]|nr:CHAT domain-containing protein [Symploca sp. SIO2D2]
FYPIINPPDQGNSSPIEVEDTNFVATESTSLIEVEDTNFVETESTSPIEVEDTNFVETESTSPIEVEDTNFVETESTSPIEVEDTSVVETESTSPIEVEDTNFVETESTIPIEVEDTSTTEPNNTTVVETDNTSTTEPNNTTVVETDNTSTAEPNNTTVVETDNTSTAETNNTTVVEIDNTSTTESNNTTVAETDNTSVAETSNEQSISDNEQSSTNSSSDVAESESQSVSAFEERFTLQFQEYLELPTDIPLTTLTQTRELLLNIEKETGVKAALIYVAFVPQTITPGAPSQNYQDQLELILVTAEEPVIRHRVEGTTRRQVLSVAREFRLEVTNSQSQNYQMSANQLYDWVITPLEAELQARGINNLVFLLDNGLRSIPIAAFHNGQEFLIEKYSIGLMPSISLSDTRYQDVENLQVLAMGAAKFTNRKSLPAVPIELSLITSSLWQGKSFLNKEFTLENLNSQRLQQPFGIIHLATHADFQPGKLTNSYIQLWDTKLRLNQLSQLGWNNPPVELLVLSACRT